MTPNIVLDLAESFTRNEIYVNAQLEKLDSNGGSYLSKETIENWYQYCLESVVTCFTLHQHDIGQVEANPNRPSQVW